MKFQLLIKLNCLKNTFLLLNAVSDVVFIMLINVKMPTILAQYPLHYVTYAPAKFEIIYKERDGRAHGRTDRRAD